MDITPRTTATQKRYDEAREKGLIRPIDQVPYRMVGGVKLVSNMFGYDILFKEKNDMFLDKYSDPRKFLHEFVDMYLSGGLPHDCFLINNHHKKSQPQVEHVHGLEFDSEKIAILRILWERYVNGEIIL